MGKRNDKPIVTRPRDNSFEAYRDWIKGFFTELTGKAWDESKISDEELREGWEKRRKRKKER